MWTQSGILEITNRRCSNTNDEPSNDDADAFRRLSRTDSLDIPPPPSFTVKQSPVGGVLLLVGVLGARSARSTSALVERAQFPKKMATTLNTVASAYWTRLRLDPSTLDATPTRAKLGQIHERHLSTIPFENLSQHGGTRPAVLDVAHTAAKILGAAQRGGFCFEVNLLLATFLVELGYAVKYVPAFVHTGPGGFRASATHVILLVTCPGDKADNSNDNTAPSPSYVTDVGFGEPPLHPLNYSLFGVEQVTPEGMRSMLVKDGDEVRLQWYLDGDWRPRLKWSYAESRQGVAIAALAPCLDDTLHPESIFSKKLIVTLLTRTTKTTLAGNRLKITSPRFTTEGSQGTMEIRTISSRDEIRQVLEEKFGIPLPETKSLQLERSLAADELVWSHL